VTEVGGEHRELLFDVFAGAIPVEQRLDGEPMAKMPNSAFPAECRVPENAERCRLGLDFS
jgi:hypothetical protein